jgi:drug/metabolite transporter (DMT)-like permease
MIWLLLSILLNTYVGIVFKVFERFGIDNLQGIVINYAICIITGCVYLGYHPFTMQYFSKPYFVFAAVEGFFFFWVFHWISKCTIALGVSATQVANKLSLVIPVVMAYFIFHDTIGIVKIIGVLLAGVAVYLASYKPNAEQKSANNQQWILPLIIFLGSGLLDTLTSYMQFRYFKATEDSNVFIIFCFASGFVCSSIYLAVQVMMGKQKMEAKSFAGGLVLGIPNFFSIYTFIKALDAKIFQASALVPVNNIGVVFASAVCAVLFFKEKLNRKNVIGLLIALLAIACIIYGDQPAK